MTNLPLPFNESQVRTGPVECLGLTFETDAARYAYFLDKLGEKLKDPEFRKIEGFPLGTDEDILALSDPPYYTACPNPFVEDFIRHYGKPYSPTQLSQYHREPFATDVSEGKSDPIYNAHGYHTKVPHRAIMRYILHYTEPGDVVFDGFCGTGMTGVAAQLCGDRGVVQELGYTVQDDGAILDERGQTFSQLGPRHAVLNDLSPAATFIAYNYNTPVDAAEFEREAQRILAEVETECGWMYETTHTDRKTKGKINYTVWSDVFTCGECAGAIVFWEHAVDTKNGVVRDSFSCPHCGAEQTKRSMTRARVAVFDKALGQTLQQAKQVPVLINYSVGKKRFEKKPDAADLALIAKIEQSDIPYWFPTDELPEGFNTEQPKVSHGFTHVHHFYTRRGLYALGKAYELARNTSDKYRDYLLFTVEQAVLGFAKISRYVPTHFSQVNQYLSGTLYVGSQVVDVSLSYILGGKVGRLVKLLRDATFRGRTGITTTSSLTKVLIPDSTLDYIFTDPPFGSNLMYSELNFLWEAWLKVFTNNKPEAIENRVQGKTLADYQHLMAQCFTEYYRALKPGRWMTVEFHNSKNNVWVAIQEALEQAGFVVADVRTLDKQHGTFKQITSASAVKQDLIISCYRPNGGLEDRFKLEAGTEDGAWDFVRTHLRQLPVFVEKDGKAEPVAERMNYLLFDRMLAFHVQRGITVPISAPEFYAGLTERFSERDGMYFLPEQAAEYDKKRLTVKEVLQLNLFVTGEASAIQWLKQALIKKPQTFQELHPQFTRELGGWQKHETALDLRDLLEQNFLPYEGAGEVPAAIHTYLSTNFKDLRSLSKTDARLRAKAKDRWYVPDPNKATDLEKVREKGLLREFQEYIESKQRRLKMFRLEAVRAGFKKAWQERDYATIIAVAEKIPEAVLQEDQKLMMWYDQAVTRSAGAVAKQLV